MSRRGPARLAAVVLMIGVVLGARPQGYLKLGYRVDGRNVAMKWGRLPVRYFITDRGVAGVTSNDLQAAVSRAFSTWHEVSSADVSSSFVGFTLASPFEDDGMSVIGFRDRPDLDRVLGATTFLVDAATAEIVEADIFFNSAFAWSVAPGGETGRYDLESIALHEIGHLYGLGHSAIGETELRPTGGRRVIASEAVMFPIAFLAGSTEGRTLKADDIAGISDLYPTATFTRRTGSISGRVTSNGAGVYGAHLVAMNPATGALVGGFSLSEDGSFVIGGLDPGPHVLRAEPLDDADVESFFQDVQKVDLGFTVTFSDRLAIVPSGGSAARIELQVKSK
jgi:hypothetical protein